MSENSHYDYSYINNPGDISKIEYEKEHELYFDLSNIAYTSLFDEYSSKITKRSDLIKYVLSIRSGYKYFEQLKLKYLFIDDSFMLHDFFEMMSLKDESISKLLYTKEYNKDMFVNALINAKLLRTFTDLCILDLNEDNIKIYKSTILMINAYNDIKYFGLLFFENDLIKSITGNGIPLCIGAIYDFYNTLLKDRPSIKLEFDVKLEFGVNLEDYIKCGDVKENEKQIANAKKLLEDISLIASVLTDPNNIFKIYDVNVIRHRDNNITKLITVNADQKIISELKTVQNNASIERSNKEMIYCISFPDDFTCEIVLDRITASKFIDVLYNSNVTKHLLDIDYIRNYIVRTKDRDVRIKEFLCMITIEDIKRLADEIYTIRKFYYKTWFEKDSKAINKRREENGYVSSVKNSKFLPILFEKVNFKKYMYDEFLIKIILDVLSANKEVYENYAYNFSYKHLTTAENQRIEKNIFNFLQNSEMSHEDKIEIIKIAKNQMNHNF